MAFSVELNRPLLAAAAISGALGVVAAAAGSHLASANLSLAGTFLQLHAPALIGISLFGRLRFAAASGWVLIVGLLLFCGDLAAHALLGASPLPIAAPLGGLALSAGWLLLAVAALFGKAR